MNREAIAVSFGVFMVGFGTNISTPFLVLYRARLGLSDNETQAIFVVYVLGILSTLMLAGQLSDRFGRRPLLATALLLSGVASFLIIFGRDSFALLLAGRVLLGVVSGAGLGVGAAWLQEVMGKGNELRAAIIATTMSYGGFGAAPPLAALYEWLAPHPLVVPYVIHIVLTLLAIPVIWRVRETVDVKAVRALGPWRPAIRFGIPANARRAFLWYVAPLCVLIFAFPSLAFALFPVLLSDAIGGSEVLVSALSGMTTAWAGLLAQPFLRRVDTTTAMGWGAAIGACGYALGAIAFPNGWWILILPAAALLGAASGIISTGGLRLIGEMTDDANRGALSSTFYVIAYLGMTMPLIVSSLGSTFGTTPVLVAITCFAGAIAVSAPARRRLAGI